MAYVNVADWKAEQVAEWLKGLDNVVVQYIGLFLDKDVNGQQLLDLQPNDLEEIGVLKIGHQEIILESVELLKNFYYDLDRENLQLLALRLSCLSHSLYSELRKNHINSSVVSTQVLADVANVVSAVKPLVCWLDRSPFCDQLSYVNKKDDLLKFSLEMAMSGMRDRFADKPIDNILQSCKSLVELADTLIQEVDDSLLLQPASLDLATLKKRPGDHLGFYIVPFFRGILQVGELKCNSAAHQCGKIETGDEIVQINYQTVVGWEIKEVMSLFEESSTEVLMTLKKRPRHSKVFGQIYIKPYRLPCIRQKCYSTKWNDLLSPSRTELLSVPSHLRLPFRTINSKPIANTIAKTEVKRVSPPSPTPSSASSISSRSSESELMAGPSSPNSVRLYLPKPRIPVQRRATITGASPVSKHAPLSLEQFWHELKLEREWRSNSDEKTAGKASSETRLKRLTPVVHCSLNWSARLCEQNADLSRSNISVDADKSTSEKEGECNGIIPLKRRIDCLNRAIEQTDQQKPKLLPKPTLSSKMTNVKSDVIRSPLQMHRKSEISARRERGKLDKSYSTPSYDYSIESKESLMFNITLPDEKVKSAPYNITSDLRSVTAFKRCADLKPVETKGDKHEKLENITEHEAKIDSDCLQIKQDEEQTVSKPETVNKILDTIDTTLTFDSEPETSLKQEVEVTVEKRNSNIFTFDTPALPPSSGLDSDLFRKEMSSAATESLKLNIFNVSHPMEKLHIHTTINVPATFPRNKMEYKMAISPPEPPPRPAKESPVHVKASKSLISKSSLKSPQLKSPRGLRKKNVWLAKRRNVSVKDLGICDHDGWLYHRSRKISRRSPQWIRGWFIIKGTIFYGFNSREATHARLMISLPGFTVCQADEVKSRNYSFKVYHTGRTFYFAADSAEDLMEWIESFSLVTVSDEEKNIIVSETDGEDDDESQPKKEKPSAEGYGPHVAAMRKLSGLLTGHLSNTPDVKSGDKKFNSLKKVSSRKSNKEDQQENSHVASLDRKYLKFFGSGGKQNFNPIPTAQFRSYRRVPPMEKSPFSAQESNLSTDLKSDSLPAVTVPSASPTRPPDMADYRLASLAKCNVNNQRSPENSQPGGYMTLESFMLSRQEEERRFQSQHPRTTDILRVPQCHAPPPPTHIISHSVSAASGHGTSISHFNTRPLMNYLLGGASTSAAAAANFSENSSHKFTDSSSSGSDSRQKYLKKTTQYQPPPWDLPVHRSSEESRLQPAFEMILDRQPAAADSAISKIKKTEESSSSSHRFKNLFSSTKTDNQKTNLISSPRLRRVLFRDKRSENQLPLPADSTRETHAAVGNTHTNIPLIVTHPPETGLSPSTPDYPGLQYPPVFEPGTYSLSDVSNLLRGSRMRSYDMEDSTSRHIECSEINANHSSLGYNENNIQVVQFDKNKNSNNYHGLSFSET